MRRCRSAQSIAKALQQQSLAAGVGSECRLDLARKSLDQHPVLGASLLPRWRGGCFPPAECGLGIRKVDAERSELLIPCSKFLDIRLPAREPPGSGKDALTHAAILSWGRVKIRLSILPRQDE